MTKEVTIFKRLVEAIDKQIFNSLVDKHKSDNYVKKFSSWSHLMGMLYMQITNQETLRAIELNFNQTIKTEKLKNISKIKRSTLADANQRRSPEFFSDLCQYLIGIARNLDRKKNDIKAVIRLIDSTPIPLKGRGLDWVSASHRIHGIKAHFILDPNANIPIYFSFTSARVNDVLEGKKIIPIKGMILIFDRAYYDFAWWNEINAVKGTFITRPKSTLAYKVKKRFDTNSEDIKSDQEIALTSKKGKKYPERLRLIRVRVEIRGKKRLMKIITNNFELTAEEIAALYKKRWEIELFFKWIKQNLKIKKFISENENAIKIQIIVAIIAHVLMKILQLKVGGEVKVSMRQLITFLKSHLFCKIKVYKNEKTKVTLPKLLVPPQAA